LTNNPKKLVGIEAYGIKIVEQIPILIPPNPHNYNYLKTKKRSSAISSMRSSLCTMSLKIAVVVSEFNKEITQEMLKAAQEQLRGCGRDGGLLGARGVRDPRHGEALSAVGAV
jgi:hypothetical protein